MKYIVIINIKKECPVGGRCNSENVVYQVNIFPMENSKEEKVYTGISAGYWKEISITVDIPLLIHYFKTRQLYWGCFGIKQKVEKLHS